MVSVTVQGKVSPMLCHKFWGKGYTEVENIISRNLASYLIGSLLTDKQLTFWEPYGSHIFYLIYFIGHKKRLIVKKKMKILQVLDLKWSPSKLIFWILNMSRSDKDHFHMPSNLNNLLVVTSRDIKWQYIQQIISGKTYAIWRMRLPSY